MKSERKIQPGVVARFRLGGVDYVVIPERELTPLRDTPDAFVDAVSFARTSLARDLRAARLTADLTQAQLAAKLKKSQAMVSAAENGRVRVGERYVRALLKACGLPPDWKPAPPTIVAPKRKRRTR